VEGLRRILNAIAGGESDPIRLAELGDERLRASKAELVDALKWPDTANAAPDFIAVI
jgi:hypothetical protein